MNNNSESVATGFLLDEATTLHNVNLLLEREKLYCLPEDLYERDFDWQSIIVREKESLEELLGPILPIDTSTLMMLYLIELFPCS